MSEDFKEMETKDMSSYTFVRGIQIFVEKTMRTHKKISSRSVHAYNWRMRLSDVGWKAIKGELSKPLLKFLKAYMKLIFCL